MIAKLEMTQSNAQESNYQINITGQIFALYSAFVKTQLASLLMQCINTGKQPNQLTYSE